MSDGGGVKGVIFTLRKGDPEPLESHGTGGPSVVASPTLLLARALGLLERQGLPPQLIAIVDVSDNPEHRFWVSNQTGVAYPRYPQIYIGDKRVGTLRGAEKSRSLFFLVFLFFSLSFFFEKKSSHATTFTVQNWRMERGSGDHREWGARTQIAQYS